MRESIPAWMVLVQLGTHDIFTTDEDDPYVGRFGR